MNILLMDTSTPLLMLGLKSSAGFWRLIEDNGMNHASFLAPKIRELCGLAGLSLPDINGVGVVTGPGSFTGLRIGLSTAKGLGEALGIPLAGIIGLDAVGRTLEGRALPVAAVLDAKKNRMYGCLYNQGVRESAVFDLSAQDFFRKFQNENIIISGPEPRALFPPEFTSENWTWEPCRDWTSGMAALAQEDLKLGRHLTPGEGPYYHRTGEEDLGISLRNPKPADPQVPGLLPGSV